MSAGLLKRVAASDRGAIDECLARYGGLVWSLARRQLPNAAEAEEAVQEIFIDVWRYAGRFDEQLASEVTFVAMIARRRLIDLRRKQQRTISTSSFPEDLDPAVVDEQDSLVVGDEIQRARELLAKLRPVERQVIECVIDQGLSHAQIAGNLNIPLGSVKTHARRGLIRLRELLGQTPPEQIAEGARS